MRADPAVTSDRKRRLVQAALLSQLPKSSQTARQSPSPFGSVAWRRGCLQARGDTPLARRQRARIPTASPRRILGGASGLQHAATRAVGAHRERALTRRAKRGSCRGSSGTFEFQSAWEVTWSVWVRTPTRLRLRNALFAERWPLATNAHPDARSIRLVSSGIFRGWILSVRSSIGAWLKVTWAELNASTFLCRHKVQRGTELSWFGGQQLLVCAIRHFARGRVPACSLRPQSSLVVL